MSTKQMALDNDAEVLRTFRYWLAAKAAYDQHIITPGNLQSLLQDLCIERRCRWSDLPYCLQSLHDEALVRQRVERYGNADFIVKHLIDSIDRAMHATTV